MPIARRKPANPGEAAVTPPRLQMADIARVAGVSTSTVSRALSGSPLVNAATRARVAGLARSLNYSINLGAKNLRLQQNRTVSVAFPYAKASRQHIADPFFLQMLGVIGDALTERGFDMLLTRVDAGDLRGAAKAYEAGSAVGVILIGQWHHHDVLNELASRRVPLIVWGARLPQQQYAPLAATISRAARRRPNICCRQAAGASSSSATRHCPRWRCDMRDTRQRWRASSCPCCRSYNAERP